MGALAEAQKALTEATERVEGGDYSEEALEALGEAQTQFEEEGGYTAEETVSKVLGGLGFDVKNDLDRPCSDFSGGWQMRIALARLLLSGPDVLFLDEPTNHLDSAARAWLATYLATYEGTLVLVSHDMRLVSQVAKEIWICDKKTVTRYEGELHTFKMHVKKAQAKLTQHMHG